jgi:hypothetical protein
VTGVYCRRPCCQRGRAFPCWSERAGSLAGGRQRVGGLRNACADRRGAQGGAGSCRRSKRATWQTGRTASQPRTETCGDWREYEPSEGIRWGMGRDDRRLVSRTPVVARAQRSVDTTNDARRKGSYRHRSRFLGKISQNEANLAPTAPARLCAGATLASSIPELH